MEVTESISSCPIDSTDPQVVRLAGILARVRDVLLGVSRYLQKVITGLGETRLCFGRLRKGSRQLGLEEINYTRITVKYEHICGIKDCELHIR